jgi:hypothetical protein
MLYNEAVTYNEPYFQYNGVRIVEPGSFGPTSVVTDFKVLKVILLSPETIGSTLVFVDATKVIISTGVVDNTISPSSMTFETYDSGYIAFSVLDEEAYAITSAQTIVLEENSAGTVDVTIIPTS